MPWLWFAGPLVFIFLAVIFSIWPSAEERRLRRELRRWLDDVMGARPGGAPRLLPAPPPYFRDLVQEVGGGSRVADAELIPEEAYVAVRAADHVSGSNHVTVLCLLEEEAPTFVCRPLPVIDGRAVDNAGVQFKDWEFMEHFLVEGYEDREIRKWLRPSLREALIELPDAWVTVRGSQMAVTLFGAPTAEEIDKLVDTADAIFAEWGAGTAPLMGEEATKSPFRDPGVVYEDEEEEEEEEEDQPEKVPTLPDAPLGPRLAAGAIDAGLYVAGVIMLASLLGRFDWFHPAVFFNSPDLVTGETWQGGWTTKGFGALVAIESYLLGLLCWQAHLAVRSGQSLGKLLLGLQMVRVDGEEPVGFWRGVFLRKWMLGIAALIAPAVAAARNGFSARLFFGFVPTKVTAIAFAVVVVATIGALIATGRALHDRLAGTRVVSAAPYRLRAVELERAGFDPIIGRRLLGGLVMLFGFVILNVAFYWKWDSWLLEVHQWM